MNQTKLDLCTKVADRLKLFPDDVKQVFETTLDEILNTLSLGNTIEIRGFGKFKAKKRRKRIGRNPRTGESVKIAPYLEPVFKTSLICREIFNDKVAKLTTPPRRVVI